MLREAPDMPIWSVEAQESDPCKHIFSGSDNMG
jgi:hypothetical protein